MKKLEILIPQYKETEDVIKPLLSSIELQQNVDLKNDIGAIICSDSEDENDWLSDDFLNGFSYDIKYIHNGHKGVSAARNACLDAATADYVMFCDADDMFYNMCGLWIVFREMQGSGFNALSSIFVEETKDPRTNTKIYINRENDSTFVHGKIYRRTYLKYNDIRFNDSLTIHEDSYFNCLAQRMSGGIKYCQAPFYLWRWRDESVCRHDPKYILKTYVNMLDSSTALVKEFLKRDRNLDAQYFATSMIYDAYFMMNKSEWLNQENQEYRLTTEKRFKEYYNEFEPQFDTIREDMKSQIIIGMKNRFFQEGMLMESITFDDWIEHIQSL